MRLGGNGERIRKRADFIDHSQSGNGAFHNQPHQSSHLRANIDDSDLELNLSSMKLDDVDLSSFGDSDSNHRINLDSNVWATQPYPFPANNQQLFRENFRSAFKPQPQIGAIPQIKPLPELNANFGLPPMPPASTAKISTLEDIERNLIIQQAIPKQQQQQQQQTLQQQQQQQQPAPSLHQQTQSLQQQDFNLGNRQHAVVTPTIPQHLQKPPQHKGKVKRKIFNKLRY